MTVSRAHVQAEIDAAIVELKQTTASGSKMVSQHGSDQSVWPAGHWRTALDLLAVARVEVGSLLDPVEPAPTPPPTPPPAAVGTGLGLIAYGGTLKVRPHLTDGTYDVVVGDWADAALLATVSGDGYAYTVTTAGVVAANATGYVILDPLNNSPLAGALSPDEYIAKCAALKAAHPGLNGIFLDNNVPYGKILNPAVPEAQLLPILKHVSDGLKAHGLKWLGNTGSFVSGDNGSNDGSIWRDWATKCASSFDYLLFENWQEASFYKDASGAYAPRRRVRGTDVWWKQWDNFQKCVGAVPGKFMGATYEFGGDLMFGTYGRASMLTAAGADPRNIFYASKADAGKGNANKIDPSGEPWQVKPLSPKVDPVAGTASLI